MNHIHHRRSDRLIRMIGDEAKHYLAPNVVTGDIDLFKSEALYELRNVLRHRLLIIPTRRPVRVSHATNVHNNDMKVFCQGWHDLVVLPPRLKPSRKQDQWRAIPAVDVMQSDTIHFGEAALKARKLL